MLFTALKTKYLAFTQKLCCTVINTKSSIGVMKTWDVYEIGKPLNYQNLMINFSYFGKINTKLKN